MGFNDLLRFLSREDSSKNVAKERLKLVLVHDRSNCSPDFLEAVKGDLIKTLSIHAEIDENEMDVKITRAEENGRPALIASIPIKSMKR